MAIIADTGGVLVMMDRRHPKHKAALDSLDERLYEKFAGTRI